MSNIKFVRRLELFEEIYLAAKKIAIENGASPEAFEEADTNFAKIKADALKSISGGVVKLKDSEMDEINAILNINKANKLISNNIGAKAYVVADKDLLMQRDFKQIIFDKAQLTIIELTKSGMALLKDEQNNMHKVPPRNVRLINEQNI